MVLSVMLGSPLGSGHLPACSPLLGEPCSQQAASDFTLTTAPRRSAALNVIETPTVWAVTGTSFRGRWRGAWQLLSFTFNSASRLPPEEASQMASDAGPLCEVEEVYW